MAVTLTDLVTATGLSTTLTLNRVGAADAGNLGKWIIVFVTGAGTISAPAVGAWTQITTKLISGSRRISAFYKAHEGTSEPASYDFTMTTSSRFTIAGVIATGHHADAPPDVFASTDSGNVSQTDIPVASVDPSVDDALSVVWVGTVVVTDHNPPTGYTMLSEIKAASQISSALHYAQLASGDPTGALTATTVAAGVNASIHLALKPEAAGGGDTGTITGSGINVHGGSITGTADANGTITGSGISVHGGTITGSDANDATGTITGAAINVSGGTLDGTAGQGATGTITGQDIGVIGAYQAGVQDPNYGPEYDDAGEVGSPFGIPITGFAGQGDTGTIVGASITIHGGTITGTGGSSNDADGTITGAAIEVHGGTLTGSAGALGTITGAGVNVHGGTIVGTAGQSDTGTITGAGVHVNGGTLDGTAGQSDEGIITGGGINVSGGTIIAGSSADATGVITGASITVHGATLTGSFTQTADGVIAGGRITVYGGTIVGTAGQSDTGIITGAGIPVHGAVLTGEIITVDGVISGTFTYVPLITATFTYED